MNSKTSEQPMELPRISNARSDVETDIGDATPILPDRQLSHLFGWRLHLTTLAVVLSLLVINLEVTIVSTSLVAIVRDLNGFMQTSWIVSAYLVTYMGFMILWSKLSDVFGRKTTFMATMLIFSAFSGACGACQTMTQLIICRTFQGVGGAGCYSMSTLFTYEMIPKSKLPLYGALNSVSVAMATLLGPLLGGLISSHTSWRWIFYLNLPIGVFVLVSLGLAVPRGFPHHASDLHPLHRRIPIVSSNGLKKVDFVGAILLLAGSLLLSSVLIEVSLRSGWSAGGTIALLVLSGISWILFFAWEWYVSQGKTGQEPLLPWLFVSDRVWAAMLLSSFLAGVPFNVVVIFLPQRLQVISGESALKAGIHLLPYTFGAAFGAALANVLGSKRRLAMAYVLLIGAVLQTIGLALLTTLPTTSEFPNSGYGYAAIAGAGMGMSFGILVLATPFMANQENLSIASGAIIQFRFLGGVIGIAIASNVWNERVKSGLANILDAQTLNSILQNTEGLKGLPLPVRVDVIREMAKAYNLQDAVIIAFAAAQVLVVGLGWNRNWSNRGWIA
ncbi:putative efflux pump antibiotic resistance protein [Mytilinidion resinicola]|uniref:Efflux pump antibiotic resistance protein n=1 Tax=Mytilinidion resinicola TaxID=574789 RepID=A0A6A6YRZ7_9PEZI|nr:putative efflux pump antibiotic resistance protein [Mytilinidion resinicola]KAF2811143.1 putative efflux pump antibiotic resistance protein [Mytilinidion resinicola]